MQGPGLSRRDRDVAWALSLDSVVELAYPPGRVDPVAETVATPSRVAGAAGPAGNPSWEQSRSGTPVPRPRIISNPDHWMPERFFQRATRFVPGAGAPEARSPAVGGSPPTTGLPAVGELRHGITYEHYLRHWFDVDPAIEVLAQGLPIQSERTLGQLDFLLRWEGLVYHLEVAIKFYLRFGGRDQLDRYVGSDLRDRLDEKAAHMLFRQRRLRELPETRAEFRSRGLPLPDRAVASIRGLLYQPLKDTPDRIPPRWWASASEWDQRSDLHQLHWAVVGPSEWFSPLRLDEATWRSGDALDPRALLPVPGRSLCVAGIDPGLAGAVEITRGYIVRTAV